MRGFALVMTFMGLLTWLFGIWQYRFERSPDSPTYRLINFQKSLNIVDGLAWIGHASSPRIRLRYVEPDSPVVTFIEFPGMQPVDFLKVRFRMKSWKLALGKDIWDDGRLILDWHSAKESSAENAPLHSLRWDDPGKTMEFVMRPKNGPALPILRLEHRGRGGEFELVEFEATVLRETRWWKIGKWFVLVGWLLWVCAFVLYFEVKKTWRVVFTAAIWLAMCIYFVVPGPWKAIRPMISAFSLGPEITKNLPIDSPAPAPTAETVKVSKTDLTSVGKIEVKGDLTLRIKMQLSKLRPVLHLLLLVAPAMLISLLVGWRPSLLLSVLLSFLIEGAQAAFGYGFDWIDTLDLLSNGLGIGIGLFFAGVLQRRLKSRA